MFKEVDEKDIAKLFRISVEQARKEIDDGTIKCIAGDIVFDVFDDAETEQKCHYCHNGTLINKE